MGLKETVRHIVTAGGMVTVSIVCSPDDSGQEVVLTRSLSPSPTPTPEKQVKIHPTISPEPTPAPTPTPTPEPILIPTVAPVPTEEPIFIPPPVVIIIEPTPPSVPDIVEGQNYQWAQILIDRTNQIRIENGLSSLNPHPALMSAGQKYAEFFYQNGVKNKIGPFTLDHYLDGTPQERAQREGYTGGVGEVMGSSVETVDLIMDNWLFEPLHRQAILTPHVREIGTGCYQGSYIFSDQGDRALVVICVQDLGVPPS